MPTSSASSGRTNVWCIASAPGSALLASAFIRLNTRTVGLGVALYATSTGLAMATAAIETMAATAGTAAADTSATPRTARNATTGTSGKA